MPKMHAACQNSNTFDGLPLTATDRVAYSEERVGANHLPASGQGETMAQVFLKDLTKRFDDVIAVRDFTLEIADGEFLVLVDSSGCGKSTTLRMVAGLEEITEGTVHIGDRVVNDLPSKDRDIAMVFQNYALYPHMSVYDNMAFGLKLRKLSKAEIDQRAAVAAEMLGIHSLLHRKPRPLRGASDNGSRWVERSSASQPSSSSTSRSGTWTPK